MNNLINNFNDKIIEVNDKLNNLKENYNLKNNSKKVNLLNLKLQEYIQSINDTINEFICDEVNSFNINTEIMQIVEQKDNTDEIIKIFGTYILLYQLSKIA
jgi:transcriptional regulator NrdR family protein